MKSISKNPSSFSWLLPRLWVLGVLLALTPGLVFGQSQFHLEEATINDIHEAIQAGQISCQGLVQAYINRAKSYNGMCTQLVTEDGALVPPAEGAVRAGSLIAYPTETVPVSSVLPNFDQYQGLPIEFHYCPVRSRIMTTG